VKSSVEIKGFACFFLRICKKLGTSGLFFETNFFVLNIISAIISNKIEKLTQEMQELNFYLSHLKSAIFIDRRTPNAKKRLFLQ